MTITIKKSDDAETIREKIDRLTHKKKKPDLSKYFGKVNFDDNGLTYQRKLRNEWE